MSNNYSGIKLLTAVKLSVVRRITIFNSSAHIGVYLIMS